MILNEQLLKRKNRIYYHGSQFEIFDKLNSSFGLFFLSIYWKYAIKYAVLDSDDVYNGLVYFFKIAKPLNVFNPRSKVDLFKLHKKMKEPEIGWKVFDDILLNYDWFLFERYGINRNTILNKIKELEYDGVIQIFEEKFKFDDLGFHSIGIFNINNLIMLEKMSYEDFVKSKGGQTIKESELMDARLGNFALGKKFRNDSDLFNYIYNNSHLTENDIKINRKLIINSSKIVSDWSDKFPVEEIEKVQSSDLDKIDKALRKGEIYRKFKNEQMLS